MRGGAGRVRRRLAADEGFVGGTLDEGAGVAREFDEGIGVERVGVTWIVETWVE